MGDLTELTTAATTNDPRAVGALAASFSGARFHLPLETLEGVKNRPETVRELGARLPIHRLRLDNGESAVPLFTSGPLCHQCAERLSWKTDGRGIKTLQISGSLALGFAKDVLVSPEIERVIVNPLSDKALHLARTDIESMAAGRELRHLWFYSPAGQLVHPVSVAGSSLLDTILATADRALQRLADGGRLHVSEALDRAEIFESLPADGPLRGLSADLYLLVAAEGFASLELSVNKSGGEVRVLASPETGAELLDKIRVAAERHLASFHGDMSVSLRFRGSSIVVTSSSGSSRDGLRPSSVGVDEPSVPPPPPVPPAFRYIPLEPEPASEDETND